jgi:L-alanine-DL-glutamate epimerase-like enolase superfamily enzyme
MPVVTTPGAQSAEFTITGIEQIRVDVPFHPRSAAVYEIRARAWSVIDLFKITLGCGVLGVGETTVNYTWGAGNDGTLQELVGRNAFDLLWDDALGAGVQMALFDAVGKALGVPCHRLMGVQHKSACPLSWWAQDMKPEAWAAEAQAAQSQGFTSMKVKARPWFDLDRQLEAVCAVVSPHFKIDADFNFMLLGPDLAAPLISRLERKYPNLAIVESPIPQGDVAGNVTLRQKIRTPIAMHLGDPPVMTAIAQGVCDGFVISGGVTQVLREGTLCDIANKPFWLQLVGTGLTAMFSVHLAAVLRQARWPAISCINIYENPLVQDIKVTGGCVQVPQGPGLGVELDWDAIERFRVADDFSKPPKREIHTITWPDGRSVDYPDGGYRSEFTDGKMVGFLPGMDFDVRQDDGSDDFDSDYIKAFG